MLVDSVNLGWSHSQKILLTSVPCGHTEMAIRQALEDQEERPVRLIDHHSRDNFTRSWTFEVVEKIWFGKMFGMWITTTNPNRREIPGVKG